MSGSVPAQPAAPALTAWRRPVALVYRAVAAVLAATGIVLVTALGTPWFVPAGFGYFTTLSNVLALAWFVAAFVVGVVRIARSGWRGDASVVPRAGAGVAFALLITMLVYVIVLAPPSFTQGGFYQPYAPTDVIVHIIVPLLALGDWAVFARKGSLRWTDPLYWAGLPIGYVLVVLALPLVNPAPWPGGGRYPYPFLDVTGLGGGQVLVNVVVLTLIFEVIGFALVGVDRLVAWLRGRSARR